MSLAWCSTPVELPLRTQAAAPDAGPCPKARVFVGIPSYGGVHGGLIVKGSTTVMIG